MTALDHPPAVTAHLEHQLRAISDVGTIDRLIESERAGRNRKTVIERSEARKRALAGANGNEGGENHPPEFALADPPMSGPEARPHLSEEAVATSAVLDEAMRIPPRIPDGIHFDVPMAEYLTVDAISNTRLGWLKRSPAHLKAYMESPPTFIDPESIGSALHALVLEGEDAFRERYAKGPCDDKRTREWRDFAGQLPGNVICLRGSDYDAVRQMTANVRAHPAAKLAFDGVKATELTGLWTDPTTGLTGKLRADAVSPELGATIDLKTTIDAAEWPFSKAIFNYGYHRQAAWYHMGLDVLVPEVAWRHHVVLAVEKERPWAVQVFRLRDDAITAGKDEIGRLLPLYEECVRSERWPAYSETFVDIALPPWAGRENGS